MTIADKLKKILDSKAAIKAAIEAKGVKDVGDVLETYPDKIASISSGGGGASSYNDLTDKPQIGGVELSGNKTLTELGIQPEGNYATKEEVQIAIPTIGENGNWVVNGQDSGKPSRGEQGNSGVSGDVSNIEVVNDLNGGESTAEKIKVLSAEQGKVLDGKISENKKQIDGLITAQKIYDALPKGSILQSAYGNIFGDKWVPMENVVTWNVSNMEEIEGTAIKGASRALYAKGYYYCSVFGIGIVYSSDLRTWSPVDIKGDTSPYYLLNFYYDKSSDLLVASFVDAVEEGSETVRIYISKDGLTWNEYSLGNDLIAVNIVSGKNSMMATVGDISSGEISFYVAEGVDLETASWKLVPEQSFTPLNYILSHIYYDETRSKFIIITGDGIYERNDDSTSQLELKSAIPSALMLPEISSNDGDNIYILRDFDGPKTYIAKNKDTSTWEEFKVQVSTDGEMLSSFVFSIKDTYYVLQPATFVGGALDSITPMGYPVFEYAVTDGEYFIGFNFTEGKIYRMKLAQALDPVQYGYIKVG